MPTCVYIVYTLDILVRRNTKIVIRPALLCGGSFPSYCVRKALLRVRITFVTSAAALRCSYRPFLKTSSLTPLEWQKFLRAWQ